MSFWLVLTYRFILCATWFYKSKSMSTWWCFLNAFFVGFWNKINFFQVKPFQKFFLMKSLTKIHFVWFFFKNLAKRYPTHIIWQAILYVQVCAWKLLKCYQHITFETSICIYMYTGIVYVYIYRNANDVKCKWLKWALCQLSFEESFGLYDWLKNQNFLHSLMFFVVFVLKKSSYSI